MQVISKATTDAETIRAQIGGTWRDGEHFEEVRDPYRGTGLAQQLKDAQRDHCLDQGIEIIAWTMDPLEARNEVKQQPAVALQLLKDLQTFRACQISYYADARAYTRIQPPKFQPQDSPAAVSVAAAR